MTACYTEGNTIPKKLTEFYHTPVSYDMKKIDE